MRGNLRPLAALALVAVVSAGCSSAAANNGTATSGGNTNAADRAQAVRFSECMRQNGVGAFPDPDPSGSLTIDGVANRSKLDTNTAAFQQAISTCKDLQPPGFRGHKRSAQEQEAALKFAQCIRDNGVKDFPDPAPDGPLVNVDGSKPGLKAALDPAMQKCRGVAASAGVVGGR